MAYSILVVDDESLTLRTINRALSEEGFDVFVAIDGEKALEVMKLGAYDYLVKPFHLADMVNTIKRAAEILALRVRVTETIENAQGLYNFGRIRTESPGMRAVLEIACKAAEAEHTTVLIQ